MGLLLKVGIEGKVFFCRDYIAQPRLTYKTVSGKSFYIYSTVYRYIFYFLVLLLNFILKLNHSLIFVSGKYGTY